MREKLLKSVGIYHFRDYWSNRQGYGKSKFVEKKALDFPHRNNGACSELFIHNETEMVKVVTADGKAVASGLANPLPLIQRFSFKEATKPMFSHLERLFPSIAALFIVLNFGFSLVFHLQAKTYEVSSFLPIDREANLILTALSNRISIALLVSGSFWSLLLICWLSRIIKDVITSGGCAIAANPLVLILFIYSGEVPINVGNYSDKPAAIMLLVILGAFIGRGFLYWLRHQATTPTLLRRLTIDAYLRTVIPLIPIFLFVAIGYVFLPDRDYPLLVRNLGISATFGMILAQLFMHLHPSLELYNLTCYLYDETKKDLFPFRRVNDSPSWVQGQYWVLRYIYIWKWEFTLPKPVRDFERIELWCNAKTGKLDWIVIDFHFRELWHRVKGDFEEIVIDWDDNFHTFDVDIEAELQEITKKIGKVESTKGLRGLDEILKLYNEYLKKRKIARRIYLSIHPWNKVFPYLKDTGFMAKVVAKEFSGRPWMYWRYALGAYPRSNPNLWRQYANSGSDYPASAHQFAG